MEAKQTHAKWRNVIPSVILSWNAKSFRHSFECNNAIIPAGWVGSSLRHAKTLLLPEVCWNRGNYDAGMVLGISMDHLFKYYALLCHNVRVNKFQVDEWATFAPTFALQRYSHKHPFDSSCISSAYYFNLISLWQPVLQPPVQGCLKMIPIVCACTTSLCWKSPQVMLYCVLVSFLQRLLQLPSSKYFDHNVTSDTRK